MGEGAGNELTIGQGHRPTRRELFVEGVAVAVWLYFFATGRRDWLIVLGIAVVFLPLAFVIRRSTYIQLGPEGFTASWYGIKSSYRWSDVESFEIRRSLAGQTVICRLAPHAAHLRNRTALYRWIWGKDPVFFPSNWEMSARELAGKLDAWKRAARVERV